MPLLRRKSVLAFKIEQTKGTAEALTAAEATYNVFNVDFQPNIEQIKREGQGSASKLPSVIGAAKGKVTFEVELCGSGGSTNPVPAWAAAMLPCCGMKLTSHTFAPTTTFADQKTATIGFYTDGLYQQLHGAMGNVSIEFENGKPAMVKLEFEGCYTKPSDVTLITPTFTTVLPPRVVSSTLSIGAWNPTVAKVTINANNKIHLREDVTAATGYASAAVVDRDFGGTLDPEIGLVATKDIWSDWFASTEAALAIDVGATAGNIIHIDAPKCQFNQPDNQEREGIAIVNLPFQLNRSGSTYDSEFTIEFA